MLVTHTLSHVTSIHKMNATSLLKYSSHNLSIKNILHATSLLKIFVSQPVNKKIINAATLQKYYPLPKYLSRNLSTERLFTQPLYKNISRCQNICHATCQQKDYSLYKNISRCQNICHSTCLPKNTTW